MVRITQTIDSVEYLLSIIRDLKRKGYIQGVDFDFEYHKPVYDEHYDEKSPKRMVIIFYDNKLATWYELTYG